MLGSAPDGEPILNPQVMCLYICNNNTEGQGGGVLVPARKVRDRGFSSCSGIQVVSSTGGQKRGYRHTFAENPWDATL